MAGNLMQLPQQQPSLVLHSAKLTLNLNRTSWLFEECCPLGRAS